MIDTIIQNYLGVVSSNYFQIISAFMCIALVLGVIYNNFKD